MAHVRQELTLDPASFFRRRLGIFLFPLFLLSLGDIVNEGGKQALFSQLQRRDGGLGGKLMTIAVTRCQLDSFLEATGLPGKKSAQVMFRIVPVLVRGEYFAYAFPDGFSLGSNRTSTLLGCSNR